MADIFDTIDAITARNGGGPAANPLTRPGAMDGEFTKGMRSGGLGAMSQINATLGGVGQAAGADDFARGRFAAADEYGMRAGEAAPRVGRIRDIGSLRDAVDYGAGMLGQMVPTVLPALGAAALTGGGAVPGMLAAAGTAAPLEIGDVIQRQRGENGQGPIDLGAAALSGGGSALMQGVVPGLTVAKAAGKVAANGVARSALGSMAQDAALGGAGEAVKQYGAGQQFDLADVGEAAAANAVGALPMAAIQAGAAGRQGVKNVTDGAGVLLDKAKTKVSEGLAGAKETAQGAFEEGGPVRLGASTAAEGLRKAMDTAKSEVDKVAEGIPLVDPAELASATGEKLNHLIQGADGQRFEKVKQWAEEMLSDNGLPPERRQELAEAAKDFGSEASALTIATAKKAWDKTKAEATRAKDWLDSLQGSKEPTTDVKKSEDYSGLNQTIKDVIMPALKERHGDTFDAGTINNVADGVRHVMRDLMKTGRVSERNHEMLAHYLGDDGARTALQELHGHVADANDKHSEAKLYEALNGMADESTSRRGRLELLRKSATSDSLSDHQLGLIDRHISSYLDGTNRGDTPAKRQYEEREFRAALEKGFGKNADKVLSAYEGRNNEAKVLENEHRRTLEADEQVDAEGFGPDAMSDRKVDAVALMNKPKAGEDGRKPIARPRAVDRDWANAKIEEVEAKNPDMKARFVTADEYRKIFGQDPHDPSTPPPEGKGYIVMEKFEPKDHYDEKTFSSLRYDTNKGDRRTDKRALRTNPDAPDSDIIDAAKLARQHRLEPGTQDLNGPQRDARAFMTGVARLQEHLGRRFDIPDNTIINEQGMTYAEAKNTKLTRASNAERASSLRLRAEDESDPKMKKATLEYADRLEKLHEDAKSHELTNDPSKRRDLAEVRADYKDAQQELKAADQAVHDTIEQWKKDQIRWDKDDVKRLHREFKQDIEDRLSDLEREGKRLEREEAKDRVLSKNDRYELDPQAEIHEAGLLGKEAKVSRSEDGSSLYKSTRPTMESTKALLDSRIKKLEESVSAGGKKVSAAARALVERARAVVDRFDQMSATDQKILYGSIRTAKSASEIAGAVNRMTEKYGHLDVDGPREETKLSRSTGSERFTGERPKGASADARDPSRADSSMSARRGIGGFGAEGVSKGFEKKSAEARTRMEDAAAGKPHERPPQDWSKTARQMDLTEAPPDPKAVAAKEAALVEKARSGDSELLKQLSESDDAKGLQRAVEHLLKHEGTEKAIDAANKRLGELVRDADTAYGMSTKKYSLMSTNYVHFNKMRVGYPTFDSKYANDWLRLSFADDVGPVKNAYIQTYKKIIDGSLEMRVIDRDLKDGSSEDRTVLTYEIFTNHNGKKEISVDGPAPGTAAFEKYKHLLRTLTQGETDPYNRLEGADGSEHGYSKFNDGVFPSSVNRKLLRTLRDHAEQLGALPDELTFGRETGANPGSSYRTLTREELRAFDMSQARPGGRAQTVAEQAAVDVHIKTVLGQSVKTSFEKIFHAGEFERTKIGDIIRLSVHSLDPMSVAHHESLHGFFQQLRDAGANDVMGVLHKAADGAPVRKQLEKLLANEPDALKQLKDSEERVAYMYQFWKAGKLNVGPETKSVLNKIADFLRQVLGIWSNDERALHIMDRFQAGDWNADRSAFARSVMETHTNKTLDSITKPLNNLATQMAVSGGAALQDSGIQALRTLGEMAKGKLHAEGDDPGFIPAARIERSRVMNELSRSLGNLNVTEAHMVEALADLQGRKLASSTEARLAVRTTRKVLDDVLKYMQSAGVSIDKIKGSQYFPRVYDADYVTRHAKDFRTVLEKNGLTPGEANRVMLKIINADGNEFQIETLRPGDQHAKQRTLAHIPDKELERFMSKDYHQIMNSYITQGTRRAEWARRFGDDNAKANALLREAKEQGATPEQLAHAEKFIRGVNGTLGDDINPSLRRLQGNMIVYQNVRLLPLAIFSMAVDPMGLVVRGGTIKDALHAYKRGITESVKSFQDNPSKDAMTSLSETLGVIDDAVLQHTLGTSFSQGMVGNFGRKVNDTFFRYNMVEQANRSMRVAATAASLKFLERHADGTADVHSKRWLSELGLQPGDVQMKNGRIALTEADGLSPAQALKMRLAVNKWVDGAVLRPDAVDKPVWMNDPHFALIAHLKQFVFSFHETVLKRVMHEYEHGNYKPAMALASYVPVMIAADLAKGVIQGGGSQPEWKDKWGAEDYVWSGVQRAGLLGVGQFAVDAADGRAMGLLGPTIEQFTDAAAVLEGRAAFRSFLLKSMPANALYAAAAGGTATDPTFSE